MSFWIKNSPQPARDVLSSFCAAGPDAHISIKFVIAKSAESLPRNFGSHRGGAQDAKTNNCSRISSMMRTFRHLCSVSMWHLTH